MLTSCSALENLGLSEGGYFHTVTFALDGENRSIRHEGGKTKTSVNGVPAYSVPMTEKDARERIRSLLRPNAYTPDSVMAFSSENGICTLTVASPYEEGLLEELGKWV